MKNDLLKTIGSVGVLLTDLRKVHSISTDKNPVAGMILLDLIIQAAGIKDKLSEMEVLLYPNKEDQ